MIKTCFVVAFSLTIVNGGSSVENYLENRSLRPPPIKPQSTNDERIYNGEQSPIHYPYQISMQAITSEDSLGGDEVTIPGLSFAVPVYWDHFCGGSILNPNFIVTAGHCFLSINVSTIGSSTILSVLAGTRDLGKPRNGQRRFIQSCKVHPDFHNYLAINETMPNDVAVCKLQMPLRFQDRKVSSIALSKTFVEEEENCTLTGWGYTMAGGDERVTPKKLRRASVNTISLEECNQRFPNVTNNEICTKIEPMGTACPGDSGGPIQCRNQLVGIVSWGVCGSADPDVNTRVSKFADFIEQNSRMT